jgi:DNA-binding NtrC family response regulator
MSELNHDVDAGMVLLISSDLEAIGRYRALLGPEGYEVSSASSIDAAREVLAQSHGYADLMLFDFSIASGERAEQFLAETRRAFPQIPVAVVTASKSLEHAIFALRQGVFEYLLEPIVPEEMLIAVRNGVERAQMSRELSVRRALDPSLLGSIEDGVFASPAMRNIAGVVEQVKDSSVPVMILGETGTGKEVVARLLHKSGKRKDAPFIGVNCASLPRELAESELFGYEKGAFTGAQEKKTGRFEEADGGTIFLDEVGELDPAIQAKLLRVLQENEVTPIGGKPRQIKTRVLVATNRDLADDVRQGRFRADLFYRLNVITMRLPPLRDRKEEIPILAVHLLERFVLRDGIPPKTLAVDAIALLQAQPWAGNVRELESTLKRSALLTRGRVIGAQDLVLATSQESPSKAPSGPARPATGPVAQPIFPEGESVRRLSEYERELMMRALAETRGNVSAAARRLGIGRSTFYRRAERYNLPI